MQHGRPLCCTSCSNTRHHVLAWSPVLYLRTHYEYVVLRIPLLHGETEDEPCKQYGCLVRSSPAAKESLEDYSMQ